VDTLTGLVEALPHWESVTVGGTDSPVDPVDPIDYEARLADPPVLSVIAACGGEVHRAAIEDGDYRMTVHLAPSVEVRRIIDAVESTYPTAELLRRQGIDRPADGPQGVQRRLTTDLTDRQQSALEAAHHAGFFEWPRDADGRDVADSLAVAPSTFHQHLRKAERKVFDSLFAAHPPA
jgi:predicted DNA binding protein